MRNNNRRMLWVRPIFQRRHQQGEYHNLVQEMRLNDRASHFSYLRMSKETFDTLLQKVRMKSDDGIHIRFKYILPSSFKPFVKGIKQLQRVNSIAKYHISDISRFLHSWNVEATQVASELRCLLRKGLPSHCNFWLQEIHRYIYIMVGVLSLIFLLMGCSFVHFRFQWLLVSEWVALQSIQCCWRHVQFFGMFYPKNMSRRPYQMMTGKKSAMISS